MKEHTWHKCTCYEVTCPYCEGGLGFCTVCNGFEGTLTTECCGRRITKEEERKIYEEHSLDFKNGEWITYTYPTTVEEAAAIVFKPLSDEFKKEFIKEGKEETLPQYHHTMGRHIRNKFRIWFTGNPLYKATGQDHADDVSGIIMGAVYDKCVKELKGKNNE